MYLSLNGVTVPNDGYVLASGIDRDDTGLHCNTDRSDCCRKAPQGEWYYPDGNRVQIYTQEIATRPTGNFFYRNRFTQIVRLNRLGNPPERGRFRCEVPNADGVIVTVYVNIGEWFVSS